MAVAVAVNFSMSGGGGGVVGCGQQNTSTGHTGDRAMRRKSENKHLNKEMTPGDERRVGQCTAW
jgi:hypothetical protein